MEELKKSIKEIVEQDILKVVISNKKDKNEELFRWIDACTRTQLMPGFEVVTLKQAMLGNSAGMIGAALLAEQAL